MKPRKYIELAFAPIGNGVEIVISKYMDEGFTLAKKICVSEGKKKTDVFMKNAIQVNDIDGLYNLRDAINMAINKVEEEKNNF